MGKKHKPVAATPKPSSHSRHPFQYLGAFAVALLLFAIVYQRSEVEPLFSPLLPTCLFRHPTSRVNETQLANFKEWVGPGLTLSHPQILNTSLRGIWATEAAPKYGLLMVLGQEYIMGPVPLSQVKIPHPKIEGDQILLVELLSQLPLELQMTVWVLYEKFEKENSFWKNYLEFWPSVPWSPSLWSVADQEYAKSHHPHLFYVLKKRQNDTLEKYQRIEATLEANPGIFKKKPSFQDFLWAIENLRSRAIDIPVGDDVIPYNMVPWADLYNRNISLLPNGELAPRPKCDIVDEKFYLRTQIPINANEQIFHNQPWMELAIFLMNFGYIPETSPNPFQVHIPLALDEKYPFFEEKQKIQTQYFGSLPDFLPLNLKDIIPMVTLSKAMLVVLDSPKLLNSQKYLGGLAALDREIIDVDMVVKKKALQLIKATVLDRMAKIGSVGQLQRDIYKTSSAVGCHILSYGQMELQILRGVLKELSQFV